MKTTLLVLAAGLGSRYGGMKQLDHLGPDGETLMEYSIYDALQAGFNKIVFVIRHGFEEDFKKMFIHKLEDKAEIAFAYQEMDNLPPHNDFDGNRDKPWGTAHAIWVAHDVIREPFAVINADDFYGRASFAAMANFLHNQARQQSNHYAMVGYKLQNTLSVHGSVARGICSTKNNMLEKVEEHTNITTDVGGKIINQKNGQIKTLSADSIVSMNFWGFTHEIFHYLEEKLHNFLQYHRKDKKTELFIPFVVDELLQSGTISVEILESDAPWFGVTYYEDKFHAIDRLRKLIEASEYPQYLWDHYHFSD